MALPNSDSPEKKPDPPDASSEDERDSEDKTEEECEQEKSKLKRVKQWIKNKGTVIIWSDRVFDSTDNWKERLQDEIPVEDIPTEEVIELIKELLHLLLLRRL